ncbi:hypothetical protein [Streptomyces regalis]|uniref:Uncharacterized protein n=1 Tax=Streptomyces regalis TaxID=68262 RepID=A0A0X3VB26_9ACTN|nr:hypothetical protein [Streptomyces regalis]KUL41627.1 hypothetical protein ADL12_11270 [Streptomyces regalis]
MVSDPSGVQSVSFELWHGPNRAEADGRMAQVGFDRCVKITENTSKCQAVVDADPYDNLRSNALAGTWGVSAVAVDGAGNVTREDDAPWPARIKRQTHLSQADATPEPVKKGENLTVKTDRNGWATTTVKATADGEYRFDFAGTSLTQARAGRTDFVDVK